MTTDQKNRDIKVDLVKAAEVVQNNIIELAEYYYELGHVPPNLAPLTRKLLIEKIQDYTKTIDLELRSLGDVLIYAAKMFEIPSLIDEVKDA